MQNFDIQAAVNEAATDEIRATFHRARRLSNYWWTRSETMLAEIEELQRRREMALQSHEAYGLHAERALDMWKDAGLDSASLTKPISRKKRTNQTVQEAV